MSPAQKPTTGNADAARAPDGPSGEVAPYDHLMVEQEVRDLWEAHRIYRFDPSASGPIFSIDTPPPYVSASHLHVGHAMSYAHADFMARYRRMRGHRVFYPMGFDDNGLPTERYVEAKFGVRAAEMPRAEFVRRCLEETRATADRYADLWRRVGLSVDWSLRYSTIDRRCQRTAPGRFREAVPLRSRPPGHRPDPVVSRVPHVAGSGRHRRPGALGEDLRHLAHRRLRRAVDDRHHPAELLPACVAVYFHPDDDRYTHLAGTSARVPLSGHEVPVLTHDSVDPGFGTGLMMVSTFGDGEDVVKWRRDRLTLRIVVGPDGRLTDLAGEFAGLSVSQARSAVVNRLGDRGRLIGSRVVKQVVGVHERCLTPVEFQVRPQWFVTIRDKREELLTRAHELAWVPGFMRRRLEDWINGLKWDWNISRQRRYGVPFPVWYCRDCDQPMLADLDALPVDPLTDPPPLDQCPACGSAGIVAEKDVMDTWMTSPLSPQINDGWARRGFTDGGDLAPMSLRVQAFEIIRTWLFYTVVQSHLLFDRLPWTSVMISGWGLNERGKKISKRDLEASTTADGFNRYVPDQVIARYGADALRLWATKARVGNDLRYHEKDVRAGRKLAVKLWNVGRFVELHAGGTVSVPAGGGYHQRTAVDRWVLSHLYDTVGEATAALNDYDYPQAYVVISRFFWSIFCDRYVEMVKDRFNSPDHHPEEHRLSTRRTLLDVHRVVLGLFAPFAPFITEHQYQKLFRRKEGCVSLHLTRWPRQDAEWRSDRGDIDRMVTMLDAVRALRTGHRLGSRAHIGALVVDARTPAARALVESIQASLQAAALARAVRFGPAATPSGVADVYVEIEP